MVGRNKKTHHLGNRCLCVGRDKSSPIPDDEEGHAYTASKECHELSRSSGDDGEESTIDDGEDSSEVASETSQSGRRSSSWRCIRERTLCAGSAPLQDWRNLGIKGGRVAQRQGLRVAWLMEG